MKKKPIKNDTTQLTQQHKIIKHINETPMNKYLLKLCIYGRCSNVVLNRNHDFKLCA